MPIRETFATRARSLRRVARSATGAITVAAVVVGVVASTPSVAGAAKKPKPAITMTVGDQAVYGVGNAPQSIPDDVRAKVMAALLAYVTAATVKPLQKGAVDETSLTATFDAAVNARATTTDRATLLDDGLPRAKGKITTTAAPVNLTALVDGDGKFVVITAALDATTTAKTAKGKVTIKRTGELVFSPDADTWKVSGYDLKVDRVGKGLAATTTTTLAGAPATASTTTGTAAK